MPSPDAEAKRQNYLQTGLAALGKYEARPALTDKDKEAIYRFRYDAYRSEGYIPANSMKLCTDDLDQKPNNRSFALFDGDTIVSSIRVQILSPEYPWGPSMKPFGDILQPHLDQGTTFIDPSRFTTDKSNRGGVPFLMLQLVTLRLVIMGCIHFRADYGLHLIRPEHGAFYKRFFGSQQWSEPRSYPDVFFPVQLYAGEFEKLKDKGFERMPFLRSGEKERADLFQGMDHLIKKQGLDERQTA